MSNLFHFLDTYKIAASYIEINNFLRMSNLDEVNRRFVETSDELNVTLWRNIVLTLYNPNEVINPFMGSTRGATSSRRKLMLPHYNETTSFYFFKNNKEHLWARFIFLIFSNEARLAYWKSRGNTLLPKSAPVFILNELYKFEKSLEGEAKKEYSGLTASQLAEKIGFLGPSLNPRELKRHFFRNIVGLIEEELISGPNVFDADNKYRLTELGLKSCELASDKTLQKGYRKLARFGIFI